jgi:guanyl-specific ribonuclease Sa
MSGRIAKSQIPLLAHNQLPDDARVALIGVKNGLRNRQLPRRGFGNDRGNTPLEGPPLPQLALGCQYFECDVGQARPGDPLGRRGSKRLVVEINGSSFQLMDVYYTDEHYGKFTFYRVV